MTDKIKSNPSLHNLNTKITELQGALCGFLDDLSYQQLDNLSLPETVALQSEIKSNIDDMKLMESTLVKYYDILRKVKLPEIMASQDITGVAVSGVGRVSLVDDMYASIKKEQQSKAHLWLGDHGHKDLIRETVHPSSLKALLKFKLKEGEEIPEDIFNVIPYTYAKITKTK